MSAWINGAFGNASGGGDSGIADGDYGDVVVSGSGTVLSVDAGAITEAKLSTDIVDRIEALEAYTPPATPAVPAEFKDSVDTATTANITLSGEQTIDGILTSGSRVLVKNQTLGATNGIYVSAAGAWARSDDADTSAEVTSGMLVYVNGVGTLNGGLIFTLATPDPITLGTTVLTFTGVPVATPGFVGKTVAGTTYTTILTDSSKRLNCTNAGTKTITVARQATVAYAVNTEIEVFNAGAGLLTLAPDTGVTLNSFAALLTVPQFGCVKLKKRANPNTWDVTSVVTSTGVGTSGQALLSNGAGVLPSFQTISTGLTNFTEAVSTAAPNATVPVVSLTATNAAANVDIALRPKASGALTAHVADSTSTGGNKRGTFAVDWQTSRSNAAEVASGNQSVVGGGHRNTASGAQSTVPGGTINTASGASSTVAGGESNTASNTRATVGGGASNTASGVSSTVMGGFQNTASGDYSVAVGRSASTRAIYGAFAFSGGALGSNNDQRREFILYAGTTDATPKAMTTDGASASTTNQIILPNTSLFTYTGTLSVRENATGDSNSWKFEGAIKRGANAAATALLGSPTVTLLGQDAGAATWTFALTADTTNGALAITVTGEASHTLRWVSRVVTTEVVG